jgi:hypothetical protein
MCRARSIPELRPARRDQRALDVPDHSDDLVGLSIDERGLSLGASSRPPGLGHLSADDDHPGRKPVIRLRERPSLDDRNAHRIEEPSVYGITDDT